MNKTAKVTMVLVAAGLCMGIASVSSAQTKDKWRVGTQSYSFNRFTFEEAMAKTKACGMKYIEVYPDQKVGKEFGDTVFKNMTAARTAAAQADAQRQRSDAHLLRRDHPGQRAGMAQAVRLREGHGLREHRVRAGGKGLCR